MRAQVAPREDASMNGGVECLDSPVEDFGKSGQGVDRLNRKAGLGKVFGGIAGREDCDAKRLEAGGKRIQTTFIRDTDQRAHARPFTSYKNKRPHPKRRGGVAINGAYPTTCAPTVKQSI